MHQDLNNHQFYHLCLNINNPHVLLGQTVFSLLFSFHEKQASLDAGDLIGGSVCPYALLPDSTELQAEMGAGVGVGQRDGTSSSYHMPVHRRAADCRTVSAKASLT